MAHRISRSVTPQRSATPARAEGAGTAGGAEREQRSGPVAEPLFEAKPRERASGPAPAPYAGAGDAVVGARDSASLADQALADPRLAGLAAAHGELQVGALKAAVAARDVKAARAAMQGGVVDVLKSNVRLLANDAPQPFLPASPVGDTFFSLVPSPKTYGESSWKWDLTFGAEVALDVAKHSADPALAASLETLGHDAIFAALQNQVGDGPNRGMVPHMNFSGGKDEKLWKDPRHSSITQPPVAGRAIKALPSAEARKAFYPAVRAELDWWLGQRLDSDGLPFTIHPWESGEDAARNNDSQLAPFYGREAVSSLELQTQNPGKKDEGAKAARFALLEALQALGPGASAAEAKALFALKSPDMAGLLAAALDDGAALAREAGEPGDAKRFADAAAALRGALEQLWDPERGFYFSKGKQPSAEDVARTGLPKEALKVGANGRIEAESAGAFLALAAHPPLEQALKLVDTLTSQKFWTELPLPTVATDDPLFTPDDYWRGSTWMNVNVLVVEYLTRYAQEAAAAGDLKSMEKLARAGLALGWKSVDAVTQGFREYYVSDGPHAGEGAGPDRFTWSTLAYKALDSLEALQALAAKRPVEAPLTASDRARLHDVAVETLKHNDTGRTTRAGEGLYPHQWGWDGAINAIGWAHIDPKRATLELSSQLDAQWKNGKVAHIHFSPDAAKTSYFPDPERWAVHTTAPSLGPPKDEETSALIQPPFQSIAALEVFRATGHATPELKALYPKLVAWHRYLHTEREGPSGLIDIVHPWESGTDNSPRWDAALKNVHVDRERLPPFVRRDLKPDGSNRAERPTDAEYDRYLWLVEQYKRAGYDDGAYLKQGADFQVGDVIFTAVMARADDALLELGRALGERADPQLETWAAQSRAAIRAQWDERLGGTYDRDERTGQPLKALTAANFAPLIGGRLGDAELKAQLDLLESDRFIGAPRLARPLPPSTSPSDPAFDPARYWRGPNWDVLTWILWRALDGAAAQTSDPALQARTRTLAGSLRDQMLLQARVNGPAEYADALTDAPLGSKKQSWSASTLLDMLAS